MLVLHICLQQRCEAGDCREEVGRHGQWAAGAGAAMQKHANDNGNKPGGKGGVVAVGLVVAWNEGGDFGGRSCKAVGDVMAEEDVDGVCGRGL